jgi:biofilm protein TabA
MIVTQLEYLAFQLKPTPAFEKAIDFLRSEGWRERPDGSIEIDGTQVYALLQAYETKMPKESVLFEGHRKYIDIQYIIEGEETIYWTPTNHLAVTTAYDETKDIWFSQSAIGDATPVILLAGQLVVLFPTDAHAPTHAVGAPMHVRKVVIKVAVTG